MKEKETKMANLQENLFDDNYLVETIEIVQLQQENQHQTVESDEFIESDKENSYDDEEYLPPSAKKSKKIKQAKKSQPMKCQSNKFFKPDSKLEIARQVREFPCLWQKKHAFYRNAGKRETAWQRIADSMQLPGILTLIFFSQSSFFYSFHFIFLISYSF